MSTSRRQFLKDAGVLAASGATIASEIAQNAYALPNGQPFGFQTFEIFRELGSQWEDTWNAMASYGYKFADLDFWGPIGQRTPEDINDSLAKASLYLTVVHYQYDQFSEQTFAKSMEDAHKLKGTEYVVLTSVAGRPAARDHKPTEDDWKWLADELVRLGRKVNKAGFSFGYHNHAQEFQATPEGKIPWDVLIENTDPKIVKFQIDVGNLASAGADPYHYLEAYPGRYFGLHVKDWKQGSRAIPVGTGSLDFQRIFAIAKKQGITNYVAEVGAFGAGVLGGGGRGS